MWSLLSPQNNGYLPQRIRTYLNRYAEGPYRIYGYQSIQYSSVIVIPAFDEETTVFSVLESLQASVPPSGSFAVILVVNHSEGTAEAIKEANKRTAELLIAAIDAGNFHFPLLLLDAYTTEYEFPDKTGGVGLARKTGLDAALMMLKYNQSFNPYLIFLDADCTVSSEYLVNVENSFRSGAEAISIDFEHQLPEDTAAQDAILFYEMYLRYYVLMLSFHKLPYAVQTVGSSMACTAEIYCTVEGMNKYKAGEDFYFFEKTAKHTEILHISNAVVYPLARVSSRVPFGTGKAMDNYLNKAEPYGYLYHPESFQELAIVYRILLSELSDAECLLQIMQQSKGMLIPFLQQKKIFEKRLKILNGSGNTVQYRKQMIRALDGFFLLKAIHYLRDNGFDLLPYDTALSHLFRIKKVEDWDLFGDEGNEMAKKKHFNSVLHQLYISELLTAQSDACH